MLNMYILNATFHDYCASFQLPRLQVPCMMWRHNDELQLTSLTKLPTPSGKEWQSYMYIAMYYLQSYILTYLNLTRKKWKKNKKRPLKYQRSLFIQCLNCLSPTPYVFEWQISTYSIGFYKNLTTWLDQISK